MPQKISIYRSSKKLSEHVLTPHAVVSIGRNAANDIVLNDNSSADPAVSRFHAVIIPQEDGSWVLQDLGSRNGLLVNGTAAGYWYLTANDRITIGDYELVFEDQTESLLVPKIMPVFDEPSTVSLKTKISPIGIPSENDISILAGESGALGFLYKLIRTISIEQDFVSACRIALLELSKMLRFDRAAAVMMDSRGNVDRIIAHEPAAAQPALSKTLLGEAVKEKRPLLIEDLSIEARFGKAGSPSQSIVSSGAVAAVCIPLCAAGRVCAVLCLDTKESRSYTPAEKVLVKFVGRDLSAMLERQLAHESLREQMRKRQAQEASRTLIVGVSAPVRKTLGEIAVYANTDIPIIINGESGTGKELIARALHFASARCDGPFIEVNCAAIPETLLESELFGVIPEYPGFNNKQGLPGKFRLAQGGTLFLDEIGDMSQALQAKLLRALDDHSIWPLGGSEAVPVDVRILAATNRDMQSRIKEGAFRLDLFQRLNVAQLSFPPLRDRREDIPLLAGFFLCRFRKKYGAVPRIAPEAVEYLSGLDWPGNIRELRNSIERAMIRAISGNVKEITVGALQSAASAAATASPSELLTLEDVEKAHIKRVLQSVDQNREKAYKILGISRAALFNKIKEYKIEGDSSTE